MKKPQKQFNKSSVKNATSNSRSGRFSERAETPASLQSMKEILEKSGISADPAALEKLWQYHNYLRDRNEDLNLTRLHSFSTVVRKHYVDCLLPLNILKTHNIDIPEPLMDMGSGAGFPGVPIAIVRPDLKVILNDGRKVRVDFLNDVIKTIGLPNAYGLAKKISPGFIHSEPVNSVITRAVDPMDESIIRASDVLSPGGLFIFLKGPNCSDEIKAVKNLPGKPCQLILDEHYILPGSSDERRLVVWKYVSRPDLSAVRISGAAGQPAGRGGPEVFEKIPGMQNAVYIESENNSFYKQLKSLNNSKNIKKAGIALVSGRKIIADFLSSGAPGADTLIFDDKYPDLAEDSFLNPAISVKKCILKSSLFREADILGTGSPLLTVRIPEIPEWNGRLEKGVSLFLPLSDPDNLGAAVRSASVFGVSQVILLSESANPYHPKAVRSSAGAVFGMKFSNGPSIQNLTLKNELLLILDGKSETSLPEFLSADRSGKTDNSGSFGVLAGMEGKGIPDSVKGTRIRIPGEPSVESLNASVALGILLYSLYLKRTATE